MLVDSHCHLNMSEFSNDLEDVISKALLPELVLIDKT